MAELIAWDGASVTRLMHERRFDEAAERVAEVLSLQPAHLPAKLARARLFLALGQIDEALELTDALLQQRQDNKWVAAVRVEALIAAGRPADARETLLAMAPPQPEDGPFLVALLNMVLAADPDVESRIGLLRSAADIWPGSQVILLKLASQSFLAARSGDATDYLERAEALGPLPAHGQQLKDGLVASRGDHRTAIRHLSERAKEHPGDVGTARRLVRALAAAGEFDAAAQRLVETIERNPRDWLTLYRLNRTFVGAARDKAVRAALERIDGTDDLWQLQFAQLALRSGHILDARAILAEIARRPAARHMAAPTLAALDRALILATGAPRVGVDMARDMEIVRVDGARATLVVFGSLVGGVGQLPFYVVDPMLARLPVNVVYLRDAYGLAYLRGVASLGADEAATVRALKRIVGELGAERVVTLGSSISGYAATRYGLAIGADATLSFAGPVELDLDSSADAAASRPTALGMQELRAVAGGSGDLSDAIAEARDRFELVVVVGGDYAPDMRRTEALAGLDNVDVVVLPGVDHHFTAHESIAGDTFLPLLTSLVEPLHDTP